MAELKENARPGVLITLEGVDGSGKTTQIELLESALREQGRTCLRLREPGGTAISEQVRQILLDPANEGMSAETELLLYEAARAQLVREVIEPALAAGTVVICDRFYDSTYSYQAAARGLDEELVRQANVAGSCGVVPDCTIVLDIDPREAYVRAVEQGADRMESEGLHFQERVRTGYLRIAEEEPERVRLVDARGDVKTVFARMVAALKDVVAEFADFDAEHFLGVLNDVERAFAEVEAAAAMSAQILAQRESALAAEEANRAEAARQEAEARALEDARRAAEQDEARAAEEAARIKAEEAERAEAARQEAMVRAAEDARLEEQERARAAEEAARARAEAEARARAEEKERARAAEEAALFAQVEAAAAAEARRLSLLDPRTFAQEEREAESDAMASLDMMPSADLFPPRGAGSVL